jgi:hypothetical protein
VVYGAFVALVYVARSPSAVSSTTSSALARLIADGAVRRRSGKYWSKRPARSSEKC